MKEEVKYSRISELVETSKILELPIEGSIDLFNIKTSWVEIAGDLGNKSEPIAFQKGRLTVITDHSVFVNELKLFEIEIIDLYKKKKGIEISKIVVKKGTINWENKYKAQNTKQKIIPDENLDLINRINKI